MYKIYINGTPLFLTSTKEFLDLKLKGKNFIKNRYGGKKKYLHNFIDLLEKNKNFDAIVLHFPNEKDLWKDFKEIYKIEKAAGGLVRNPKNELLMIFRRGHWDLPKGKIEKNEGKKEAALREVKEETGLENVNLEDLIGKTYHTYSDNKDRRILKVTYWYNMRTDEKNLIPQTEEDIEEAIFVDFESFFSTPKPIYGNILDIVSKSNEDFLKD